MGKRGYATPGIKYSKKNITFRSSTMQKLGNILITNQKNSSQKQDAVKPDRIYTRNFIPLVFAIIPWLPKYSVQTSRFALASRPAAVVGIHFLYTR